MAKIKGWKKITDSYIQLHWNNVQGRDSHNVLVNKIRDKWVIDINHYFDNYPKAESGFSLTYNSREKAVKEAIDYMKAHPRG